jgi:hypothetical protein
VAPTAGLHAQSAESAARPPRLLFGPADLPGLRLKLLDGGDDDRAYQSILSRWESYANAPAESLLANLFGAANIVNELGLMAHLENPNTAQRQKIRGLVLTLARTTEADGDDFASSLRLRILAFGYDMGFSDAPVAEQIEVRTKIQDDLAFMMNHSSYTAYALNPYTSNRGMTVGSSMGLAAIAIWSDVAAADHPALAAAMQFGDVLVNKCLDDILASDGSYREGVLYCSWAMRMGIPYFEARRRFDGADLAANRPFKQMLEWLAYEVLPEGGGRTNNLNDSPWFSRPLAVNSTLLDWGQFRYRSLLARWLYRHVAGEFGFGDDSNADRVATALWNRPLPNIDPAVTLPSTRIFGDRGLYFHRSAWKNGASGDETLFSFFAGRFFGGHAQEDQGQFTLYAYGDRFAVDNGSAYPTPLPKETAAHNLVLIDGLGQHNAGSSIGTDAGFVCNFLAPFSDYVRADLGAAYSTHSPFNNPGFPLPDSDWSWGYDGGNPVQRAERSILVVKGAEAPTWFLICDDLQKDNASHTYEWLLHTDATNAIELEPGSATIHGTHSRLLAYFAHPRPPVLQLSAAVFANGGEDPSTARLVARVQAVAPRYVVGLIPLPNPAAPPAVDAVQTGRATTLHLDWGGAEDFATFNPTDSLILGPTPMDGKMAFVRMRGSEVVAWTLVEGRTLRHDSINLLLLGSAPSSASFSGTTLHFGDALAQFIAWGPAVTSVLGPTGIEVPFVREGPWVRSNAITDVGADLDGRSGVFEPGRHPIALHCAPAPGSAVRVTIHDVRGRLVRTLGVGNLVASERTIVWDETNDRGTRVGVGVYFARAHRCNEQQAQRLVVVR